MCGIAGVVNLAEGPAIERAMLEPMAEAIRHRGPDDEGFYIDPHKRCGLAFRRLAIVDLVTGNQPIQTPDEGVNVVFNGEIYNFRELREELEHLGCEFRTQGDAEVVAWAYARWGPNCFKHFNGMFAIAVWDAAAAF